MLDEIVSTLEEAKELPAVKKAYKNSFVQSKLKQFEGFLGKIVRKNVEKAIAPLRKKITLANRILINVAVFAYFAGIADTENISYIEIAIRDFKIIGLWAIIANISSFLLLEIKRILKILARVALTIAVILVVVFAVYWLVKWIYSLFNTKSGLT